MDYNRDKLICILLQPLVNQYDLRINEAFRDVSNAPLAIIEAFRCLNLKDRITTKTCVEICQRHLMASLFAINLKTHQAEQLKFVSLQAMRSDEPRDLTQRFNLFKFRTSEGIPPSKKGMALFKKSA